MLFLFEARPDSNVHRAAALALGLNRRGAELRRAAQLRVVAGEADCMDGRYDDEWLCAAAGVLVGWACDCG